MKAATISTPADVLLTPRRQRTRDRLLDAAYEVFAEQGVHASTVEEVCERAGFTRGAFYSNFTTKEELFAALMERQHNEQLAALAVKVDRLRPKLEAVTAQLDEAGLGDLMLEFLTGPVDDRTWCLIDHEFQLMSLRDPEVAAVFTAHKETFETSLLTIVRRALTLAGRRFVLPDAVAVRLLGHLYQDMLQQAIRAGRSIHDEPYARDTMVSLVLVLTRPADGATEVRS